MKNVVYVVANVATETIILITFDRDTAYRAAMIEQKIYGARKKDVSITPMLIDIQMGRGTSMCYDDADLSSALCEIKEWSEDEDEDEDEDDWDKDEDEDEDEDDYDDDVDECGFNPYFGGYDYDC